MSSAATASKEVEFVKNYDGTRMKKRKSNRYGVVPPMRMPYEGIDVPHIVIEVNQKCNITCHACYKNKSTYTRTVEQVKSDIDIAISKRNLSVITLAGGEPTLHPDLPEIIRYVTSKGIDCQILSNGLSLNDEMLQSYKKAGLVKVYIHIDSLQTRPDAPDMTDEKSLHGLREKIGGMVRRNGLHCALSFTLYRKNMPELVEIIDFVVKSPNYERMLITCCTDFTQIAAKFNSFPEGNDDIPGKLNPNAIVTNGEVKKILYENLGMEPYAYVGSSHDTKSERWIFYYSFLIQKSDGSVVPFHFNAKFRRIVQFANPLSKKLKGRYPFGRVMSGWKSVLLCLVYGLINLNIAELFRTLIFLSNLLTPGSEIHQRSFVFQTGPTLNKKGEIEYCRSCPDSTIRNGELVPVCLADFKHPLPTSNSCDDSEKSSAGSDEKSGDVDNNTIDSED